jgi:hypothetical protein
MKNSKLVKIKEKQRAKKAAAQKNYTPIETRNSKSGRSYNPSEYQTQMQKDKLKHKECLKKAVDAGFLNPDEHSDLRKAFDYITTHLVEDEDKNSIVVVKNWFRPVIDFDYKEPEQISSQQVREKETDSKRVEELVYEFETMNGLKYPIFTEELASGSSQEGNVSGHHRRKAWMKKYPGEKIPRFLLGRPRIYSENGQVCEWGNTSVCIDSRTGGHASPDYKPFGYPDAAVQLAEHYTNDNTMRGWNPNGTRPPRPKKGARQPFDQIVDAFFPDFKDRWDEKVRGKIWEAWIGKTTSSVGVVIDIDDKKMEEEMKKEGMPIFHSRGNKKGEKLSKIQYCEETKQVFGLFSDNGKNFEYQITEAVMNRCVDGKREPFVLLAYIHDCPNNSEALNKKRKTFRNRIANLNERLSHKNFAGARCPIIQEVRFMKQLNVAADNGSKWVWGFDKDNKKAFVEFVDA